MAKKKKATRKKSTRLRKPKVDSADGVAVGEEPVPGMRLRAICRGHEGTIGRIAWSPCGRFIASPSKDKTIRIWDANDGKCLAVLKGHDGQVFAAGWAPNGELLASGSDDNTVRLWEVKTALRSGSEVKTPIQILDAGATVFAVSWTPDGRFVAGGAQNNTVLLWDAATGTEKQTLREHQSWVLNLAMSSMLASGGVDGTIRLYDWKKDRVGRTLGRADESSGNAQVAVAWSPDCGTLGSGGDARVVAIWDTATGHHLVSLEGHAERITSVSFSIDGRLIASKSQDNTVRLWKFGTWEEVFGFNETTSEDAGDWQPSLAFSPTDDALASLGDTDHVVRIWDLKPHVLLDLPVSREFLAYTSAKIVLVGESNVGKSCLAMRLAEDRYPEDHEHGTTHGMRFWPMEAEELHPAARPPDGQRRDVVLWDFGGQDEYQLVHQMFLHDTTLALVLIDPTRGRAAMDEARDWNKRLEKHLGKDRAVKLLVGAKVDKKRGLIDQKSIDDLCEECGFSGFLDLSARTGRNTKKLRKLISDALDWDQMAKTSRPELFQHIRDDIETRRKKKQIVLTLDSFKKAIRRSAAKLYEEAAVDAVSDQLATQGVIVRTKLTGGDEALVLQLPQIERYAGSLIIAARNNPRGVPVLEERLLGSTKTIPLPGMTKKERLSPAKERMVLECVVELMIQHGICFRHGGLLVFPTLFPAGDTEAEPLPHSVSLYYDFTGAIDNIYASLVSKLMVSEDFGDGRLKTGSVEFDRPGEGVCGIRQIKRSSGLAHVDLYFADETEQKRRDLFTTFVEQHLRSNGVEIREHQAIKCSCGKTIDEEDVQANVAAGEEDVICPRCRNKTLISEGVSSIRERDPESDQKLLALRKVIEEKTNQDAARLKQKIATGKSQTRGDAPIRILHLSDLHFTGSTIPKDHLRPLLADLRNGEHLGIESVDYIVISGDMTDRGGDAGFDKAREFTLGLIEELGTDAQKCIFVPGNHDVQDLETAYRWFGTEDKAREYNRDEAHWHREGSVVFVEDRDQYSQRLKRFNDAFFSKVVKGEEYPLNPDEQGLSYLFPDTGIQFLTLNSAWQIDQFNRNRSGINASAINQAASMADQQIRKALDEGRLKKNKPRLRLAVWHHALEGKWAMQDDTFLEHVQAADVKLCLHGDVHESRRKLVNWWDKGGVHIVGAGTFGSPEKGRPESTPRLYNLLEIQPDLKSIRVHTREQRSEAGAWKGWHDWPNPDGAGKVPYFDIELS